MNTVARERQTTIACPSCHATNRMPPDRDMRDGHCGRCGNALFDGRPVVLGADSFDRHVAKSSIPVVVDFWAPWCGPCRAMAPIFERAASELEPRWRFAKVNTDEAQRLSARLGIRSIPTLVMFRDGVEVARNSGAMDYGRLTAWLHANG